MNDYKVNLFEIAFLDRDKVKFFKSNFKIVADYFVQMRESGDYVPSAREMNHVQETLSLLSVMTEDHRFEEALHSDGDTENGKEVKNMCEVLDRVENKGRSEGRIEGKVEILVELVREGLLSIKNAAMRLGITEEEFCEKYPIA